MTRILTWEPGMPSTGSAAIAIGVFDGVHLGHQALVKHTADFARALDVRAAVITFDQDPDRIVSPDTAEPQLLDIRDKLRFLAQLGADIVLVVPFDTHLAALSPDHFLRDVVLTAFEPMATVVGHDFRFGARASGDVSTLERYGAQHSFTVIAHELVTIDEEPVTSTRVRATVASGDVSTAARLLGRPHRVRGRVVHGRGEGAAIGIPTANLRVDHGVALPGDGVYAGFAVIDEERIPAAISIGVPPTFPQARDTVEAHLIGRDLDLYGTEIVLGFERRLRDQQHFSSTLELADAIRADVAAVSRIASGL